MQGATTEPILKPFGEQRLQCKTLAHQPATPTTSFDQTLRGNLEGAFESTLSHKGSGQTPTQVQSNPSLEQLPSSQDACNSHPPEASNQISLNQSDETETGPSKESKDSAKEANDLFRGEQNKFPDINASSTTAPSDDLIALADVNNQSTESSGKQVVGTIPVDDKGGASHRGSESKQPLKSNPDLIARSLSVSRTEDRSLEKPTQGLDTLTLTDGDRRVSTQLLAPSKERIPHGKHSLALNPNQAQAQGEAPILPQSQKATPSTNATAANGFQSSYTQSSQLAGNQLLTQSKGNIPHAKHSLALNPSQDQVQEEAPILPHFRKLANSPDSISNSLDKHLGDQNNSTASLWEVREKAKARATQNRPGGKNLLVSSGEVSRREITAQDKRAGIENEKKVSRRKSPKTTLASAFQLTSRANSSTNTADGMPPAQTRSDRVEPHTMRHDSSHNHKTMESKDPQPFDKLNVENHASKQERETYPLNRFKLDETEAGQRPASTGEARSEIIATRSDLTTHGAIIPRTRLEGLNVPQSNASTIQRLENIIQDQVKVLNSSSSKTLSVAVKPDTGLAMTLTLQQVDQQILVSARMDEHTANLLKPQWAELQKELESQGIRLNHQDSDQPFQSKHQQTRDESMSQDNGEKWTKQTQYRDQSSKHSEKPAQVKTKISHTTLDSSPEEHLYYA